MLCWELGCCGPGDTAQPLGDLHEAPEARGGGRKLNMGHCSLAILKIDPTETLGLEPTGTQQGWDTCCTIKSFQPSPQKGIF